MWGNGPGPGQYCTLPDLLHTSLGGLGLVCGVWQCSIVMNSCSQCMWPPTMAGYFPVKPYADLGTNLDVTWAQSKSATLASFSNCDMLAAFR